MQLLQDTTKLGARDIEYAKSNTYATTNDGFVVGIPVKKPRIQKDVWRADTDYETGEYVSPSDIAKDKEHLKDLWVEDNLREFQGLTKWLDEHPTSDLYLSKGPMYCKDSNVRYFAVLRYGDWEIDKMERKATEDEIEFIRNLEAEQMAAFKKRLETYWKRYSDKIGVRTYWADR